MKAREWLPMMVGACLILGSGHADAQVSVPTSANYSFSLPIAKLVPNPCTGGFTLVEGTASIAIGTETASDFSLWVKFNTEGRGQDATATGVLISDGSEKPMYVYSSITEADTYFPDGTPSHYLIRLPILEQLNRAVTPSPGDAFLLKTEIEVTFSNGIPSAPVLRAIDVSCK